MAGILNNFFSNRSLFYNLFNGAAKNVTQMADLLVTVVNIENQYDREQLFKQIDKLENNGDDITHKIFLALDKVIFTPINRGAIHTLAGAIDDVSDAIHEASGRMNIYKITYFGPAIKQTAALIFEAANKIENAVVLLSSPKSNENIILLCRHIKQHERQADLIYYQSVAQLFSEEKDAINLIKYREIMASLENSVNCCKKAAEVLESIALNN